MKCGSSLLCYLLGNLPLTGFLYNEYRKLTWTVCGVIFFTIMVTISLWKWHNVSVWTMYSCRCESLFSTDSLNDCYNSLEHYRIPVDHPVLTVWGSLAVHYLRIICRWWYNGFLIQIIFSCVGNTLPVDLNQNAIWNTDQNDIQTVGLRSQLQKKKVLCDLRHPHVQKHQFTKNSLLVLLCE